MRTTNSRDPRLNLPQRKSISKFAEKKPKFAAEPSVEQIPELLDKLLHISKAATDSTKEQPKANLPTKLKRPLPTLVNKRFSIAVKTTINSPARKIPRRSVMPTFQRNNVTTRSSLMPSSSNTAISNPRKSILPLKITSNGSMRKSTAANKTPMNPQMRKSLAPTTAQTATAQPRKSTAAPAATKATPTTLNRTKKPESVYSCIECAVQFRIKSLYNAHMRQHEKDVTPMLRKASVLSASSNSSNTSASCGQCKYCDKTFALVRTLHIHLMNNCPKIPPAEKRKLHYTELNHVEKAQLPSVFHQGINTTNALPAQPPVIAPKRVVKNFKTSMYSKNNGLDTPGWS